MSKQYEAPVLREMGSLKDLTRGNFNKVGQANDIYSQLTNGIVIGSLTPPKP
jgi:hypothetical protein